jgi:hypothetical protein
MEVLPDGPYTRLQRGSYEPDWSHPGSWLKVIVALLFGALTHLVWDGFTHENARGVRLFPQLLDYGPDMAGHALRLYRWLQYGSSVAGLVVVLIALGVWLAHAPVPHPRPSRRLGAMERGSWLLLYAALPVAGIALITLQLALRLHVPLLTITGVGAVAVVAMRAATLSLLLVSVLIRARLSVEA